MKTAVEKRYPEAGFVIVNVGHATRERRMVYASLSDRTKRKEDKDKKVLVLSTGNWGELTSREKMECKTALTKEYPDHEVLLS